MNKVKITAIRQTVYPDLMAKYENPIEHTCDFEEGQQWISVNGKRPPFKEDFHSSFFEENFEPVDVSEAWQSYNSYRNK